jgi:hypothetical protein
LIIISSIDVGGASRGERITQMMKGRSDTMDFTAARRASSNIHLRDLPFLTPNTKHPFSYKVGAGESIEI